MWEKIAPPPTHRSRDTAHAQWLQTHCQWYPIWKMSELITQERIAVRIFKLGGWIDHVTLTFDLLTLVSGHTWRVTWSRYVSAAITL